MLIVIRSPAQRGLIAEALSNVIRLMVRLAIPTMTSSGGQPSAIHFDLMMLGFGGVDPPADLPVNQHMGHARRAGGRAMSLPVITGLHCRPGTAGLVNALARKEPR